MALNATGLASDMLSAYDNAGKLVGMDSATKSTLQSDWEFMFELLFTHFKDNAVITVEADAGTDGNTRFNQAMSAGVPIAQDGGIALQNTTVTASATPSTDTSTGTIE